MYATCTFCHAPLGRNEALEHFPVGRKVAIDQSRGRLWAVCVVCGQWNLSPIERRWEAIEEGERLFRDARRRVSTDQIGLARLPDETELIRIGEPQRPEFAAWRYGARFAQRWRVVGRASAATAAGLTFLGKIGGLGLNLLGTGPALGIAASVAAARLAERRRTATHIDVPDLGRARLTYAHVAHARVHRASDAEGGWLLRVPIEPIGVAPRVARFSDPFVTLTGAAARTAAARIWPRLNRGGGPRRDVAEAVRMLEAHPGVDGLLRLTASHGRRVEEGDRFAVLDEPERDTRERVNWLPGALPEVPGPIRLAVEMALHEEDERQVMRGELLALERRWREAEEVAAIADGLVESPAILRTLERLRLR